MIILSHYILLLPLLLPPPLSDLPRKSTMGEDGIVDLLWKSCRNSHTQRPSFDPPPILRDSGEGNAPLPLTPPPLHHQLQEDEMASWLHHPNRQDYFYSQLLGSVPMAQPPSLAPSAQYVLTAERPTGQVFATRRAENFMNFSMQTGNIFTSGVEARPSMQVGSSATPSSSAIESCVIPATEGTKNQVSLTLAVPGFGRDEKVAIEPVCEIAGTKAIQIQTGTEIADDKKRKVREETIAEIQGTEEARGSTSRKRSRAAEMHNLSERRRREKINEKMKTLRELIPRCSKTDKASTLDDVIEYVKSLQMQEQMMSMGHGMMPPMMHAGNIQQFMPHMAMRMMDMHRPPFFPGNPFPRPAHMAGLGTSYPAPRYPFDPSRAHLRSPHPNPVSNQPQFPAYMNPYSQFAGLHRMQQAPPPLQSQTTSQLNFISHASSSKDPNDQDNQSTG